MPSKSIYSLLSFEENGTVNVFRYHPVPAGNAPWLNVVGYFSLKLPSMLQSCGRFNFLHFESSYLIAFALLSFPKLNLQSLLNLTILRWAKAIVAANKLKIKNAVLDFIPISILK